MDKKSHKVVPPLKITISRDSAQSSVFSPPAQSAILNSANDPCSSTSQQNDVAVEESLPAMEEDDINPLNIMTRANNSMASDLIKAHEEKRKANEQITYLISQISELSEITAKVNDAAAKEALLRRKMASLKKAKTSLKKQLKSAGVQQGSLRTEIGSLITDKQSLQEKLNHAEQQEGLLREKIGVIEKEKQSLQEQLTVATEEKRVLEQSFKKEMAENVQLKKKSTAEIGRLNDLLQHEQNKVATANTSMEELRYTLENAQSEIVTLKARKTQALNDLEEEKKKADEAWRTHVKKLENETRAKEEAIETLEKERHERDEERRKLDDEVDELKEKRDRERLEYEVEINKMNALLEEQKLKVVTANETIEELQLSLDDEKSQRLLDREQFVKERKKWADQMEKLRQEREIEKAQVDAKMRAMEKETEAMWQQLGASVAAVSAENPAAARGLSRGLHQLDSNGPIATLMETILNKTNDHQSTSSKIPQAHSYLDTPTTSSSYSDRGVKRKRSGVSEEEGKRFLKKE